jgi:polar amino acid transport system substrate-binding protein
MNEERKLTWLGKLAILAFIGACFWGAWRLFNQSGLQINIGRRDQAGTSSPGSPAPQRQPSAPSAPSSPSAPAVTTSSGGKRTGVLADIKKRGYAVVGHENNAPPMYFADPQGRLDGFEYRLALDILDRMDIKDVRFVAADYGDLPGLLTSGKIDLIVAGYVPDPAINGVEWSDSYLDFGLCLIVLKSSAVTEVAHLTGKTIAVYDDPAAVRWVQQNIPGAKIKTFSGDTGWFESVEKREADALVYDYPFAAAEIKNHPRTKIVRFNLNQSKYAIGLPAGNDDLLDAVNRSLRNVMGSATYADLVRAYLSYQSEDLSKPLGGGRTGYTVQPGDTLGSIATRRLGSGDQWTRIWDLNRERIPNPHLIFPGYVLVMP